VASSDLDYRDRSIKLQDGWLTLVFKLMTHEGRIFYANNPNIIAALDKWDYEMEMSPLGLFYVQLNGFWETDEGHELTLSLLDLARQSLLKFDGVAPGQYLDEVVGFELTKHANIPTANINERIDIIANLIQPNIESTRDGG
jgi:hypothetical protein